MTTIARSRNRDTRGRSFAKKVFEYPNGSTFWGVNQVWPNGTVETISDYKQSKARKDQYDVHPCTHLRRTVYGGDVVRAVNPAVPYFCNDVCAFLTDRDNTCISPWSPGTAGTPTVDWASLVSEWKTEMSGYLPVQENLFLDLAEVGELIELCSSMRGLAKSFLSARSLKTLTLAAINGDLIRKFGLTPLLGQIEAIFTAHQTVARRLQQLTSFNGKWRRITRTRRNTSSFSHDVEYGGSGGAWQYSYLCTYRAVINGYCLAYYRTDSIGRYLQFMHDYGFSQINRTLWEHFPLSFVVDWCIAIGRKFEALDSLIQSYCGGTPMLSCCLRGVTNSVTYHVTTKKHCMLWSSSGDSYADSIYYDRQLGIPSVSQSVWPGSGWTLGKAITAAELVVQRLA